MRQIWRYYKITVTLRLECERNNTLPFKRHCYILISTDKKFERKSAYQVIIIITWFRRQPFGSFLKSSISNMYRKVRLRQNWRSQIWGVKILPHNQDECDFMLILLSVSCFTTPLWRESVLCLIWNLCWESVKHRYHYCVIEAYLLKYTVICRLVRLDEASGGHWQLPLWRE